jgi:TonB dependent receptor/TonB-dependent Receptor Plug Domain/Carboxypeptidase regulatory-like domain
MNPVARALLLLLAGLAIAPPPALAQQPGAGVVHGHVRAASGDPLPGVMVTLRPGGAGAPQIDISNGQGAYAFTALAAGHYSVAFALPNFTTVQRTDVTIGSGADAMATIDATLHLSMSADVIVTGKESFVNIADVENPAEDLIGIAASASQGAVTARQIDQRPIMRAGEVLETVPGVIISQHSGEGKANQYYLRGFNLDHGTDFFTTVAGIPVNMPTHAHGHGYSDANFLIPELVSGVQFVKGPYFAEQGDFSAAGAANINYVTALDHPIARISAGGAGWARFLTAASPRIGSGSGHLLYALELNHHDGPWTQGDDYQKVNGVLRYSQGDARNGLAITAMGYRGTWRSTDQVPDRAIADGTIGRFDAIDPSDGGSTYRYSLSADLQRTTPRGVTKVNAYALKYGLNLFSNFTYALEDPIHGDQFEQVDRRWVFGGRVTHRWFDTLMGRPVDNIVGLQLRHDDIGTIGLYHTDAQARLDTIREDAVQQTSGGLFAQTDIHWTGKLRTQFGIRGDLYRFGVTASDPLNGGRRIAGLASPKAGVVLGPWSGTEFYVNAGTGFHSNDARGATITRDPVTGEAADHVTPLVRARGAEVGVRTVRLRHLQSTVSLWTLSLDSELVFAGDAGTTEASRPSRRTGVEWTNYYRPLRWLTFDADVAWSHARFTSDAPEGAHIPGAAETVTSIGVTVDPLHHVFGSVRLRYFGPRPLIEDNSVRSEATSLVNGQAGYELRRNVRLVLDVFNLLNARASDVDYFYASRLPGEPADGVLDIHTHPTLPRTARVGLLVEF